MAIGSLDDKKGARSMTDRMKIIKLQGLISQLCHDYKDFDAMKEDFMSASLNEILESVWEVYGITFQMYKILFDKEGE